MYFHASFSLNTKRKSLNTKDFSSRNEQNTENTSHAGSLSEEFLAVDDNNVGRVPIITDKDIWEFSQSSKNTIDADSEDKNEMNNAAPDPKSSEMRNIMKSMRSYLGTYSNGEMNNKIGDIE
ncbi:hypothetical protein TNCV_664611 [Trichonephila clavipes]|nr:hypothetical protein TNCV_664611 [Trichonephila clavipes]